MGGLIEMTTAGKVPGRVIDDGKYLKAQGTRDGALFTAEWVQAKAQEGRVFCANSSKVSTVTTFGAGSITTTEYDLMVSVPAGTTIIPLSIRLKIEAYGSTAIFECMASCGTGGALVGGTDDTDIVVTNLRTDEPFKSLCSIGAAANSAGTYMTTNISEFWREGLMQSFTQQSATISSVYPPQIFKWSAIDSGVFPVLVGAAQLAIYASAQAGTGFITLIYAEVPSTDLN